MPRIPANPYSSDGARARTRQRERETERTMSSTQFHQKDTNVQTGVTQMARHTQKVNYEAVERKGNYGRYARIRTYLQKQSQECYSSLTAKINSSTCRPTIQTDISNPGKKHQLSTQIMRRSTFLEQQCIMIPVQKKKRLILACQ